MQFDLHLKWSHERITGIWVGVLQNTDTFLTGRYVGLVSQDTVLSVNVVKEKEKKKLTVSAAAGA